MKRWLDLWALRRLTRHLEFGDSRVVIAGKDRSGYRKWGRWCAYKELVDCGGRPNAMWERPFEQVPDSGLREALEWLGNPDIP